MVAAHATVMIYQVLDKHESFTGDSNGVDGMYHLSWYLLRFIQKNFSHNRCLSGDKCKMAEDARRALVQGKCSD